MNSIIMKNINLGETKLQLLVTFKEYQLLLERANASEYTNFQVINMSNNQYDLRSTKRGLVPIVTIGTLLGIFLGVLFLYDCIDLKESREELDESIIVEECIGIYCRKYILEI